jgi:hypothetical protein
VTVGVDMATFHRAHKPALLAPPSLPAAARARNCLTSVLTIDSDAPTLRLPYAARAYLASLGKLLDGCEAAAQSPREGHAGGAASAAGAGANQPQSPGADASLLVPAATAAAVSIGGLGPEVLTGGAAGGAGGAGDGAARTVHVFCPPVFGYTPSAAEPSHRLLWKQFGLLTVLCYVDAAQVAGKPSAAQERRLAAAAAGPWPAGAGTAGGGDAGGKAGSLPGSPRTDAPSPVPAAAADATAAPPAFTDAVPPPALDINVTTLGGLIGAVHDVTTTYLPRIEAMVSDAVDAVATVAVTAGMDDMKQVHWDALDCVAEAHGLATITRRPGKGRDTNDTPITRSMPVRSSAFVAEVPRHLWVPVAQAQDGMPPGGDHAAAGLASAAGAAGSGRWAPAGGATVDDAPARSWRQLLRHVAAARPRAVTASHAAARRHSNAVPASAAQAPLTGAAPPSAAWPTGRTERSRSRDDTAAGVGATSAAYPATEEHWFSTRYVGGAAAVRAGPREAFFVFDGKTPSNLTETAQRVRQFAGAHMH